MTKGKANLTVYGEVILLKAKLSLRDLVLLCFLLWGCCFLKVLTQEQFVRSNVCLYTKKY